VLKGQTRDILTSQRRIVFWCVFPVDEMRHLVEKQVSQVEAVVKFPILSNGPMLQVQHLGLECPLIEHDLRVIAESDCTGLSQLVAAFVHDSVAWILCYRIGEVVRIHKSFQ
jgi:hypothetical protein